MTSSEFSLLTRSFPGMESERIPLIEKELQSAPYCQTFHLLIARFKKDADDPQATTFIQRAALYAADRPHLKHLLELTLDQAVPITEKPQTKPVILSDESENNTAITKYQESEVKQEAKSVVDIADVLMTDLGILKEKTKAFDALMAKKTIRSSAAGQKIIEEEPAVKTISVPQVKQAKAGDENDLLLLEIKSTRKKIKSENTRKAEQIEIIDQFIKARQVTIRPPEKGIPKQDLTESAASYSENVISETLVEILVRQGKKDKAIDVLKKLIWKFPQKKHLFAARIQDISK
ncbi:MAG: hypothetical protein ACO3FI_11880 [Cyclobacteriaceae bacterium]